MQDTGLREGVPSFQIYFGDLLGRNQYALGLARCGAKTDPNSEVPGIGGPKIVSSQSACEICLYQGQQTLITAKQCPYLAVVIEKEISIDSRKV